MGGGGGGGEEEEEEKGVASEHLKQNTNTLLGDSPLHRREKIAMCTCPEENSTSRLSR